MKTAPETETHPDAAQRAVAEVAMLVVHVVVVQANLVKVLLAVITQMVLVLLRSALPKVVAVPSTAAVVVSPRTQDEVVTVLLAES